MKYLIVIFFLFAGISSFAQQSQGNDTSKYVWYKYQYGSRMPRAQYDSVLNTPRDTTYSKTGIARKGTYFYVGNGTYWTLVNSSTQTNYNSIDSATTTGNEVCLWSLGVPFVCFTINSTPGDTTIAGLDSVIVQGNLLCQWKAGVSTCYTISNTIINNTNNYITNVYTGVDSVVVSGTNLCQWSGGIATCYTISTAPGDTTISGIDSVTIQGSQLCQWKAGVSTCYTVTNTINNSSVTNYIDSSITNVYNYLDSSTVIINSGSGLDSIRINGYQICFYLHDSASPRCWQLNTFFDDVRLSDDSTLYEFYNGDSLVKTVPSGIKNVGAVWPLSYDGVDLTTSKPFNDSLYLSSLVKHSDSLFSKKLTGDSVFVGLMSGSGGSSSGIDSMYVTTDSLYQVFIYHSGRRDSVGYSGSSGTGGGTGTVTSIATGYGLSGGTITSSGTIIADSAALSLKYLRRADSVGNTGYSQLWRLNKVRDSLSAIFWNLTGNTGTDTLINFIGTTDLKPLIFKVNGRGAGAITDSFTRNTSFGYGAMRNATVKWPAQQTAGSLSSAFGYMALFNMTTGQTNTAMGPSTLSTLTTGNGNTAIGANAMSLSNSSTGVAIGSGAIGVGTGSGVAVGFEALKNVTSANDGGDNVAMGNSALLSVTSGTSNTAIGHRALTNNTASNNTAIGNLALYSNTSGIQNTAIGLAPMYSNATGNYNTAIGYSVMQSKASGDSNTAVGYSANVNGSTSSGGVYLGNKAGYNNTSNNKLFISNSDSHNLIHGDFSTGQVQINAATTPSLTTSAQFEVISTTKGILIPRMTTTQKNAISSPAEGLEVYDLTLHQKSYYNGTTWINY